MKRPMSKKPFLWGLMLLTLSAGPVGCFIVYGGSRARSSAHSPAGRRCVNRPLLQRRPHHRSRGALEAHLLSRTAGSSAGGFDGQRRLPDRRRSAGITRLRQKKDREHRLLAASAEGPEEGGAATSSHQAKGGVGAADAEIEGGNYTPEEREFIRNFYAEYEAAEDPKPDEDERAVYESDYKMYSGGEEASLNIEWDAAMGKADYWNLPPYEEFDPKVPPVHYKYYEEELQANLKSEVNPFPLHSEWVDRDIKVGDIDEEKKAAIEPMMSVIEQVCELIDTTDDVFSFKYVGPIRHKKGIASWALVLIKRLYPQVKGVEFVTNRTRDRTDW